MGWLILQCNQLARATAPAMGLENAGAEQRLAACKTLAKSILRAVRAAPEERKMQAAWA